MGAEFQRVKGIIAEHLFRREPHSREFLELSAEQFLNPAIHIHTVEPRGLCHVLFQLTPGIQTRQLTDDIVVAVVDTRPVIQQAIMARLPTDDLEFFATRIPQMTLWTNSFVTDSTRTYLFVRLPDPYATYGKTPMEVLGLLPYLDALIRELVSSSLTTNLVCIPYFHDCQIRIWKRLTFEVEIMVFKAIPEKPDKCHALVYKPSEL